MIFLTVTPVWMVISGYFHNPIRTALCLCQLYRNQYYLERGNTGRSIIVSAAMIQMETLGACKDERYA